jgi:hypothetical protein
MIVEGVGISIPLNEKTMSNLAVINPDMDEILIISEYAKSESYGNPIQEPKFFEEAATFEESTLHAAKSLGFLSFLQCDRRTRSFF